MKASDPLTILHLHPHTNQIILNCQCRRCKRHGFDPWVGKMPWSRKWQPTPVFLPGKSHGQTDILTSKPPGKPILCASCWNTGENIKEKLFSSSRVMMSLRTKSHSRIGCRGSGVKKHTIDLHQMHSWMSYCGKDTLTKLVGSQNKKLPQSHGYCGWIHLVSIAQTMTQLVFCALAFTFYVFEPSACSKSTAVP